MKQFKIRASKGSVLLTAKGAVSKAETPRSYIKEWLISQVTGKEKQISSKYLRRGIESENLAIERVQKLYKTELKKNEEYFENEFFTGTPDILVDDEVIDVKCPWDAFTFPFFMKEPPIIYVVQLQIYMNLTGKRKAKLIYCLENGTNEQIDKLSWEKARENGNSEPSINDWDEAEAELNYDHLDDYLRMKIFEIEYNEEIISNLKEGVLYWREYIEMDLIPEIEAQKDNIVMNNI
jgi:hypothetical protein